MLTITTQLIYFDFEIRIMIVPEFFRVTFMGGMKFFAPIVFHS
jgi:hypothetical protein